MSEEDAIASSNKWINIDGMVGYLNFEAANFLVGTGKWEWHQSGWMGYVVRKRMPDGYWWEKMHKNEE
jgi:hypothetical protein